MQRTMIAVLLAGLAGCGEEPEPPKRTKAPEPPPVMAAPERKSPPPAPPPREEMAKPPSAPPEAAPPIPKVLLDPSLPEWSVTAPAEYTAKFSTSRGEFAVLVHREWAPRAADRFYALVKNGFFNQVRFFRVVANFMAQFGMNGEPQVTAAWKNAKIQDDAVTQTNSRGMLTFATSGPNSRTTQVFINFKDNSFLDGQGFAPFGKVVEGMEVLDQLYNGYGDGPPRGRGPSQGLVQQQGNEYLKRDFKELDFVKTAAIVEK